MKRAIEIFRSAGGSVWSGIAGLYKRFDWAQAKDVEGVTLFNACMVLVFYTLALVCLVAAFFGAWHQLLFAVVSYVMGAVFIQDDYLGNEKAVHYFERCFSRK